MKKGLIIVLMCGPLMAITVSNKSSFDVYGATYYFHKEAERVGEIKLIRKGQKVEFERPDLSGLRKRKFVFSINKDDLKDKMSSSEYHLRPHFSIGLGNKFYIDLDRGSFKGHNVIQWNVIKPLKKKLGGVTTKLDEVTLGMLRRKYLPGAASSLRNVTVSVRRSTDLPPQELSFLSQRRMAAKPAMEQWLGIQNIKKMPTIAIAGSGGGYRAMLGYLGVLQGAEDTGLLDVTTYLAGLSGSTWALGPWMSSGWSLEEFKQRLLGKIETDLTQFPVNVPEVMNELLMRVSFKQPITAVNIYGWILGHNLMGDFPGGPLKTYLHNQAPKIQNGSKPMPIYTAVATKLPYQWVEFTPWEFGGDHFGGYIPVWAFGAPFLEGKMRYFTPPYSLSFILAICGSAFAARLSTVVREMEGSIPFSPLRKALKAGMGEFKIGKHRISAARVFNWTWGMRPPSGEPLPRAQQEIIKLIDAGLASNLPLESLYRREVDIMVVADFSDAAPGAELKKAEDALRAQGYKVPPINYEGIGDRPFRIFKDENDPSVPIIIYLPHVGNPDYSSFHPKDCLGNYCGTFNFKYSRSQSKQLIGLSEHSIKTASDAIKEEIRLWIESH